MICFLSFYNVSFLTTVLFTSSRTFAISYFRSCYFVLGSFDFFLFIFIILTFFPSSLYFVFIKDISPFRQFKCLSSYDISFRLYNYCLIGTDLLLTSRFIVVLKVSISTVFSKLFLITFYPFSSVISIGDGTYPFFLLIMIVFLLEQLELELFLDPSFSSMERIWVSGLSSNIFVRSAVGDYVLLRY